MTKVILLVLMRLTVYAQVKESLRVNTYTSSKK